MEYKLQIFLNRTLPTTTAAPSTAPPSTVGQTEPSVLGTTKTALSNTGTVVTVSVTSDRTETTVPSTTNSIHTGTTVPETTSVPETTTTQTSGTTGQQNPKTTVTLNPVTTGNQNLLASSCWHRGNCVFLYIHILLRAKSVNQV